MAKHALPDDGKWKRQIADNVEFVHARDQAYFQAVFLYRKPNIIPIFMLQRIGSAPL